MGIELPAELRAVAEKVGARWPEADEDAMRTSATTWRDTAASIESLASSADGAAQAGLGSLRGAAGDAAGREWKTVIGEDGPLPASARECTAAADRLEHAADQIGAAKVRMVRDLVAVAKQVDAAEQAAGLGNPQALGGLDTVLRGASAGLAQVHDTLSSAVDIDSGVTMESGGGGPAGGLLGAAGGLTGGVTDAAGGLTDSVSAATGGVASGVGETVGGVAETAGAAAGGVAETAGAVGGVAEAAGGTVGGVAAAGDVAGGATDVAGGVAGTTMGAAGGVTEAVGHTAETVGGVAEGAGESVSESARGATGTAQSTVEYVGRPAGGIGEALAPPSQPGEGIGTPALGVPGNSEHTGPISIGNGQVSAPGWGGGAESTGPVSVTPSDPVTSPQAVQSAWAGSPGPAAGAMPGAAAPMPPPAQVPQVPQGPPPPIGGFQGGGAAAGPPLAAGGHHGGPVAQPQRAAQPFRPQQPMYGVAQPQPAPPPPPAQQPHARAAYRQVPQPPAAPAPPQVPQHDAPRPARAPARSEAAVAFVLHQFPMGYMPVAASRSSRQLPLPKPESDPAAGLRFPPQDHPRSSLVDDTNALSRAGSSAPVVDGEPREVPAELVDKHEPLGELAEVEWERRFLASSENGTRHYVWRASPRFPEGCVEAGEPIVLDPDTLIDRFGDGEGRVFAPVGTAVAQRSLPPEHVERGYRRYRVLRPLPVWQGVAASSFGQPGGGLRYRATYPLAELVAMGFVVELTHDVEVAEAHTLRLTADQLGGDAGASTEGAQRKDGE